MGALTEQIAAWGEVELHEPATADAVRAAEEQLGAPLPGELRDLLHESDGVSGGDGYYGLDLVWPVARIGEDNAQFRSNPDFLRRYLSGELDLE